MKTIAKTTLMLVLAATGLSSQAPPGGGGVRGQRSGAATPTVQTPVAIPPEFANLSGDPVKGKDVYLKYSCYSCHLYSGNGYSGAPGGANLVSMARTLPQFILYIRNPPRPQNMPPFTAKVMTDQQAADLWAYIKTFTPSPAAKDIPLLNQIMNEK